MSEFERIARLTARFRGPRPPALGIGDDAAVLHGEGPLVVTVDASVEGVHFHQSFASLDALAARAVEAAASDLAAMGARIDVDGAGLAFAWSLPQALSDADFDALVEGSARAAERMGAAVVGGNLTRGPNIALTTTALGRLDAAPLTRAGARPGDHIAVTGSPGRAAAGLGLLLSGRPVAPSLSALVDAWRAPRARLAEGHGLATGSPPASACIDLSDGLAADAAHLARASGVALVFDDDALTADPLVAAAAAALGRSPLDVVTAGGEDYELLATGPRACFGPGWRLVGRVTEGAGLWRDRAGQRIALTDRGFDHFAR
ncbi:MAG: thiamine-phosphate kinase [Myxococcales bacterium]|nr:thiamine-phosphate kinase [Myxococcales bacterium]